MLTFYLSLIEDHSYDDDFERIYYKYREMIFKVAKSHTHNHHFAEEAVQNVFIGVARNIDKIKNLDEKHLEIYLCKASKNSAFSVMRKENQVINNTVALDNLSEELKDTEVSGETIFQNELLKMILEYIRSMDSEYSDVLTYYFLFDLTLKECSIALQMPLSTVKTRFYKGQKMIQEKFKEYRND